MHGVDTTCGGACVCVWVCVCVGVYVCVRGGGALNLKGAAVLLAMEVPLIWSYPPPPFGVGTEAIHPVYPVHSPGHVHQQKGQKAI